MICYQEGMIYTRRLRGKRSERRGRAYADREHGPAAEERRVRGHHLRGGGQAAAGPQGHNTCICIMYLMGYIYI